MVYDTWTLYNLNLSDTAVLLPVRIRNFFLNLAVDSSWMGFQQDQPSQQVLLYWYSSQLRRCFLTSNLHHFIELKALQHLFFLAKNNNIDYLLQQHVCSVMDSSWDNSGGCLQPFWKGTNFKVAFSATSAGILHVGEFDLHIWILCIQMHFELFLWINPSNLRNHHFLHGKNNRKWIHNTMHSTTMKKRTKKQ